jgi:hypothetical protein
MKTLSVFPVNNREGNEFLDDYVRPVCNRLGISLAVSKPGDNRAEALRAQHHSDFVLWDCSVEPGHAYNAFNEWVKNQPNNIIVSRTPLPRNVLARDQFAPIHGERFDNGELGAWLDRRLSALVSGRRPALQSDGMVGSGAAGHYWMFQNPADFFLSLRGTKEREAKDWVRQFSAATGHSVRIVPEAEYAYRTECLTRQQMWEAVARLTHEMTATRKVAVFLSEDYFDSFWTSSELLSLIKHRSAFDGSLTDTFLARPRSDGWLLPLSIRAEVPVPTLTSYQSRRLFKILNNTDPMTVAPETQVPPSGFGKLLALVLRSTMGYYDPEFTGDSFWKVIRVPCTVCRPGGRTAGRVDWDRHLFWPEQDAGPDYFGYFPCTHEQLATGIVHCPGCRTQLRVRSTRPPRTLWVPVQTTEKNRDRPVIQEHPVWEVEE